MVSKHWRETMINNAARIVSAICIAPLVGFIGVSFLFSQETQMSDAPVPFLFLALAGVLVMPLFDRGEQPTAAPRAAWVPKQAWVMVAGAVLSGALMMRLLLNYISGVLLALAPLVFGGLAALAFDPGLAAVYRFAELPRLRHLLLVSACAIMGYALLYGTLADIGSGPSNVGKNAVAVAHWTGRILLLLGPVMMCVPFALATLRPLPAGRGERPLWPVFAGIAGAAIFACTIVLTWAEVMRVVVVRYENWEEIALTTGFIVPPAGLALGAGAVLWLQAVQAGDKAGLEWSGMFPASVRTCMAMLLVALAMFVSVQFGTREHSPDFYTRTASMFLSLDCLAWLVVVLRIGFHSPSQPLRALVAWGLLLVLIPLTFLLSATTFGGNDRLTRQFVFLIAAPVAIATLFFILLAAPPLLEWVMGRRARRY